MQIEYWPYLLTFIVPALTALVFFLKKEGRNDAKQGLTGYEVKEVKEDIKEIRADVKDLYQKSNDALRLCDILDLRLKNVELDHRYARTE